MYQQNAVSSGSLPNRVRAYSVGVNLANWTNILITGEMKPSSVDETMQRIDKSVTRSTSSDLVHASVAVNTTREAQVRAASVLSTERVLRTEQLMTGKHAFGEL